MRKNDTYVILLVTNQSGCDYSFLATIGFIAPDKKMINSRHTGMIIWIIKILRRLHDTFYKQNVLSLAFRQRDEIGGKGFCHAGTLPKIARIAPHFWEEPCISGENGSGTIFFSSCVLGCVFCQNSKISREPIGKIFTKKDFIKACEELIEQGVNNINLVSPTPYAEFLLDVFKDYRPSVPIVFNTGGYESAETIHKFEGIVDIYMPDFKYASNTLAKKYSNAPNYLENALASLKEMISQSGEAKFDDKGIMQSGVIVRHLILPNNIENSFDVLDILDQFSDKILLSLMSQYIPLGNAEKYPEISRRLTEKEYQKVLDYLDTTALDGFLQELSSASEEYVPDFNLI